MPTGVTSTPITVNAYTRTIAIDGTNDFVAAENALLVGNEAQNGSLRPGSAFYLSWDANNIYLGYLGSSLTNDTNRFLQFYIRGGVDCGVAANCTTTRDDLPGGGDEFGNAGGTFNPSTPMNWHFYFRTDGAVAPQQGARVYASGWGGPLTPPDYSVASGGDPAGTGTASTGASRSRATLNLTGATDVLRVQGSVFDPNGNSTRFPIRRCGVPAALRAGEPGQLELPELRGIHPVIRSR